MFVVRRESSCARGARLRSAAALRRLREIVGDVHSFCPDCWKQIEFLGNSGCATCGMPLPATEQEICGRCLEQPPRIARSRAAVAYDDLTRGLAIRLKYGRKVAIARTMARFMAPLVGEGEERVLVPVPLHRTRLWSRGFNQSALVARELSRRLNIAVEPWCSAGPGGRRRSRG